MKYRGIGNVIQGLIGVLIFVVIAANLIPTVANAQQAALNNTNVTGAAAAMTGLLALIFVALIVVAVVRFMGGA